jgi:hypothetical protein
VTAAILNVTVTRGAKGGVLTAYPDGAARPTASNLNWAAGRTVANVVTVPVRNGRVALYNNSAGTVHMVADVVGYYSATGAVFWAQTPQRLMDTRAGVGAKTLNPNGTVVLTVSSPTTKRLRAVVLNVTATRGKAAGYVTVYPDGVARPATSTLNWTAGRTVSNLTVVRTDNGKVDFRNASSGSVDLIADAFGYFTD